MIMYIFWPTNYLSVPIPALQLITPMRLRTRKRGLPKQELLELEDAAAQRSFVLDQLQKGATEMGSATAAIPGDAPPAILPRVIFNHHHHFFFKEWSRYVKHHLQL